MDTSQVHTTIDRLQQECSDEGWDSYGAAPVQPNSARLAHALADGIAEVAGVSSVTIVPSIEGGYEYEWDADGGGYYVSVVFVPDVEVENAAQ